MTPTAKQVEINKLYHELGSPGAVAKKLGMAESGIIKHLFRGARNGLPVTPDQYSPVAPAGWSSTFKTVQYNGAGEIIQTWDRIKPDEADINQILKFLEDHTPVFPLQIPAPRKYRENLMLEWKLFDQHHTMHAWGEQTGADYSIKHSEHLIRSAAGKIFEEHGPVDTCVIILGGDNMHTDNRSNRTEKSGHALDVDSRYQKGLQTFVYSMVHAIDLALTKARNVVVEVLSGNHDWHSAIAIAMILQAHYRNSKRVFIDPSPMEHKFFCWGTNYFMYSHGNHAPPDRYANFVKDHVMKNNITGLKRIYVRVGHLHSKKKVRPKDLYQSGMAIVEYFDTLAAPDAYATGAAFSSTRATTTDIFHKEWGKRGGMELTAEELLVDFKSV